MKSSTYLTWFSTAIKFSVSGLSLEVSSSIQSSFLKSVFHIKGIKTCGQCLHTKILYYSNRRTATSPSNDTSPPFQHLTHPCPSLKKFWTSFCIFSCIVAASSQNVYLFLLLLFWLWGRARSYIVPDPVSKVDTNTHDFMACKLASFFWWHSAAAFNICLARPHKDTHKTEIPELL